MNKNIRIFNVPNLSGGLNTRDAKNVIQVNQSPDMLNMTWTRLGAVTRRHGFRLHVYDEFPAPIYGLFRYRKKDGTDYLMVVSSDTLWAYKGAHPYANKFEVKNDLTASIERFFIQMNDWMYMSSHSPLGWGVNGTDPPGDPIRWNGLRVVRFGHHIFGNTEGAADGYTNAGFLTPTDTGTGRMNADGTRSWNWVFTNSYAELGDGPSPVDTPLATSQIYTHTPAADTTQGVLFTGFNALIDPLASHVKVYRSLASDNGGSSRVFYYVGAVKNGTNTFTDVLADSELVELMPEDPFFHRNQPPQFKYIAAHKGRAFIANVNTIEPDPSDIYTESLYVEHQYKNRVYWSDLYQADRIMGFVDVGEDHDEITQIISFNNILVVFKQATIHAFYGDGPSSFTVREINHGLGCIAPRSVAVLDNVLIFLGNDGQFNAFDGVNFRRISEVIRPTMEALSNTRLEMTAGGVSDGKYYGSVPRAE